MDSFGVTRTREVSRQSLLQSPLSSPSPPATSPLQSSFSYTLLSPALPPQTDPPTDDFPFRLFAGPLTPVISLSTPPPPASRVRKERPREYYFADAAEGARKAEFVSVARSGDDIIRCCTQTRQWRNKTRSGKIMRLVPAKTPTPPSAKPQAQVQPRLEFESTDTAFDGVGVFKDLESAGDRRTRQRRKGKKRRMVIRMAHEKIKQAELEAKQHKTQKNREKKVRRKEKLKEKAAKATIENEDERSAM